LEMSTRGIVYQAARHSGAMAVARAVSNHSFAQG